MLHRYIVYCYQQYLTPLTSFMKQINPCFTIGTIGIILTSVLQIITTIYISSAALHIVIYILYPIFVIMLVIGYIKILKEKNHG
jgi:hypothetical protein